MADGPHGFDGKLRCSFCGKTQNEVDKLIAGEGVYICNECVRLCTDIIDEEDAVSYTHLDVYKRQLITCKLASWARYATRGSRRWPRWAMHRNRYTPFAGQTSRYTNACVP